MILLHSCCGPCSASVLPQLDLKEVKVWFYNPSIYPEPEYYRRLDAQKKVCDYFGVELIVPEYDHNEFISRVVNYIQCPECGSRCSVCFYDRFVRLGVAAKELGADTICTTLTVSPYKDSFQVLSQLYRAANICELNFIDTDFEGCSFKLPFQIYEQDYCGCEFSIPAKPIERCNKGCANCII